MIYESLSNNYYFTYGIHEMIPSLSLSEKKRNVIIDLSLSMIKSIVLKLDDLISQDIFLVFVCNQTNLFPLAAYWRKKYKDKISIVYIKDTSKGAVKIHSFYKGINHAEYGVLESIVRNVDAKSYAKKNMVSNKTYYSRRSSLCNKLNFKRNMLYL